MRSSSIVTSMDNHKNFFKRAALWCLATGLCLFAVPSTRHLVALPLVLSVASFAIWMMHRFSRSSSASSKKSSSGDDNSNWSTSDDWSDNSSDCSSDSDSGSGDSGSDGGGGDD